MTFRRTDQLFWSQEGVTPEMRAAFEAAILANRSPDPWQAIAEAYRAIIEDAAKVPLARVMRDRGFGDIAIGIDLDAIELRHTAAPECEQSPRTVYDEERAKIATGGHRYVGLGAAEENCEHGRSAHTKYGCLHCSCRVTYHGGLAVDPVPDA